MKALDIDSAAIHRRRDFVEHHHDTVNDGLLWQTRAAPIPDLVTRRARQADTPRWRLREAPPDEQFWADWIASLGPRMGRLSGPFPKA